MDILEQQEISQSKYISWHIVVVVVENPVLLSVISLGPTLPKQYKRAKALQRPQLGEELRPPKNGAINVEKWMTIKSLTMTIWRYKGGKSLTFFLAAFWTFYSWCFDISALLTWKRKILSNTYAKNQAKMKKTKTLFHTFALKNPLFRMIPGCTWTCQCH